MMRDMVTDGMCMAHSICAYSYALGPWRMMIYMVTDALIPIDMVTDASLIATVERDMVTSVTMSIIIQHMHL